MKNFNILFCATSIFVVLAFISIVPNAEGFRVGTFNNRLRSLRMSLSSSSSSFDYDVIIVGCGVGGHGAALHARANGLKTAVLTGKDVGGTCVNRGCVPSKALLAASGRVRELKNTQHLKSFGISVEGVKFDRAGVAGHASQLANKVKNNLEASLKAQGVDVIESFGELTSNLHEVKLSDVGKIITAKDIILAPGSVPFVPKGVQVDEKTVFTSDGALRMEFVPDYVAIIGSGYIGLEFSDVYTALGSEVTFIEAMDTLMPTFDPEIRKLADRILIKPRAIDSRTNVFATEVIPGIPGEKPVSIKMIDAKTKEFKEILEVDACLVATGRTPNTGKLNLDAAGITTTRGFIAVNEHMQVYRSQPAVPNSANSNDDDLLVPHLYCIGDANGKLMLAHAASAQGISAIENILHRPHRVQHRHIPAACFTHPEIAMVGMTEPEALALAKEATDAETTAAPTANATAAPSKFTVGKSVGHFRANSKALAELESDGIAKVLFKQETGELLGVHIIGLHAADLIQECANAMMAGTTVQQLAMMTHTHPTLSEVLDAAFKGAVGMAAH